MMNGLRLSLAIACCILPLLGACAPSGQDQAAAAATLAAAEATQAAAQATKAAAGAQAPASPATAPPEAATPQPAATRTPAAPAPQMPPPQRCADETAPLWHWQAGKLEVHDFSFATSLLGFALLDSADYLLRTADGGQAWRVWPIGSPQVLNTIHFSSPLHGWAAGEEGTILHTADGGDTWIQQASNTDQDLLIITFLDEHTGWAAGANGIVLRTTDGGSTWSVQAAGQQFDIVDLCFIDRDRGYAVGHSGPVSEVLSTSDGGVTWQETEGTGSVPEAVFAAEGTALWLAGGWVNATVWKGVGFPPDTEVLSESRGVGEHFRELFFSDAQHGWAVGDNGLAVYTEDGGDSWHSMGLHESAYWEKLSRTEDGHFVLAGYSNDFGIHVVHSVDGGKTWSPVEGSSPLSWGLNVHDVEFVDPWFGWALVDDVSDAHDPLYLLATVDGGHTWSRSEVIDGTMSITFVDRLRGWAIGRAGLVARTDDGGGTWEVQAVAFPGEIGAQCFLDHQHGWVVANVTDAGPCAERYPYDIESLALYRTSTGGDAWDGPVCIQVPPIQRTTRQPPQIQFVDPQAGWIVHQRGLILRTADGGSTWEVQASGTALDLSNLWFLDRLNGWVTGDDGVLLHTANGGENWTQQRLGEFKLTAVGFVDPDSGWVASHQWDAPLYRSSDGGETWHVVGLVQGAGAVVDAVDREHVWIGTTNGGIAALGPLCLSASSP